MARDRACVSACWRHSGQSLVGKHDKNLQEKHNCNSKIYEVVTWLPGLDVALENILPVQSQIPPLDTRTRHLPKKCVGLCRHPAGLVMRTPPSLLALLWAASPLWAPE